MKILKVLPALGLCMSAMIASTPLAAEDLHDIYLLALQNDASYLASEANYEAAKLNLPLARSGFKPNVNSSGTLGQQRSNITGETLSSDNNNISLNVDLPLYDRSLRIGITQAELNVENASLQLAISRDDLTLRVADRYFNVLAARDSKEVARLERIAIKRQMDLASERLDVGLGTRTDLFDAQARFEQANADVIAADIRINNARQALVEIIGIIPTSIDPISQQQSLKLPEPNELSYWTKLARNNNLRVRAEDLNLLVASHEIDRLRAARHPTLSVGASSRYQESGTTNFGSSESSTNSIGLILNVPIYLGGSINLRTKQAGLQFNAREQLLELTRRQARTTATSAFLATTSGISQVQALEEAIRAGKSALEAKEEGFSAGLTTNLDVLDAQRDLSRSRTDYLRAKYNYFIAVLQLEQATGGLTADDILFINQWIDQTQASAYPSSFHGDKRLIAEQTNWKMMSFQVSLN